MLLADSEPDGDPDDAEERSGTAEDGPLQRVRRMAERSHEWRYGFDHHGFRLRCRDGRRRKCGERQRHRGAGTKGAVLVEAALATISAAAQRASCVVSGGTSATDRRRRSGVSGFDGGPPSPRLRGSVDSGAATASGAGTIFGLGLHDGPRQSLPQVPPLLRARTRSLPMQ